MRVILAYKNFGANRHISHIGLGVAALQTNKVLLKEGITSEVLPILDANHLRMSLNLAQERNPNQPITHVIISAPWIPTESLRQLLRYFPRIQFSVCTHSNVGFLQADPQGTKLFRETFELELAEPNFSTAANSLKMARWCGDAYGSPCRYLPNLYFLDSLDRHRHVLWNHSGALRIGCFGAVRPQKNLASSVAAAIEIGHQLKARTEIWISSGRTEGGGNTVLNTVREMVRGLPTTTLHESGWQSWPQFRRLVGSMHLLLQPSYTESFNMVTADGISEGVPSVVGEAIGWVPEGWRANVDDVFDIARVGRHLLRDEYAGRDGLDSLKHYVEHGLHSWKQFLRETRHP